MSGPDLEEDSLISQDDIDKLLASSSIEEAEEKFSGPEDEVLNDLEETDELTELESLSQDDIDSLMNIDGQNGENQVVLDDLDDDDIELISQDDIDSLMNSSLEEEDSSLDQDPSEEDDEALEMISQEDINDLLYHQAADTSISGIKEETGLPVEKNDIDLTQETAAAGEAVQMVAEEKSRDDDLIDESEAVDVKNSLIAQETIDELIKDFDDEKLSEPVILDEEIEEPDQSESAAKGDDTSDDDIKDFLKFDTDIEMLDFEEKDSGDVTQEDIDALLLGSIDDDDDVLISQDDIDTLLMAADQEDEDVLGDLMDKDFAAGLDEDDMDDDIPLEAENFDKYDDEDKVVLEGYDEVHRVGTDSEKEMTGKKSGWFRSKLVAACVTAFIVLGITVPAAYFVFFSGKSGETQLDPAANFAVENERELEIETVHVKVEPQTVIEKPGNILLKDFVILASDLSKDMVYISTDISIDYSNESAYHEIQNNLSFYRDLIYDSINKNLASEKRNEITEADILLSVETSLKKALPGNFIDRVSFKSFKAS